MTHGYTLDTGALIAMDLPSKSLDVLRLLRNAKLRGQPICIPANVIAQAWRSPRQVRLARLLRSPDVEISVVTQAEARAIGQLCASSGHSDIVDVDVALSARQRRHVVVTSDPGDITKIDSRLPVFRI